MTYGLCIRFPHVKITFRFLCSNSKIWLKLCNSKPYGVFHINIYKYFCGMNFAIRFEAEIFHFKNSNVDSFRVYLHFRSGEMSTEMDGVVRVRKKLSTRDSYTHIHNRSLGCKMFGNRSEKSIVIPYIHTKKYPLRNTSRGINGKIDTPTIRIQHTCCGFYQYTIFR